MSERKDRLSDRIEAFLNGHPAMARMSTVLAVGAAVASVVIWMYEKRIEAIEDRHLTEVANVRSAIASIERTVDVKGLVDIDSVVLRPMQSLPPDGSSYFDDGGFYAQKPDRDYSKIPSQHYFSSLLSSSDFGIRKVKREVRFVYRWRFGQDKLVVDGRDSIKVGPGVDVEKVPITDIYDVVYAFYDKMRMDTNVAYKTINRVISNSGVDWFMLFNLLGSKFPELLGQRKVDRLLKIQKSGNVMYGQMRSDISGAVVDGKVYGQYYLHKELLVVQTDDSFIIVNVAVPSEQPVVPSAERTRLTEWFAKFAMAPK